MYRVSVEDHFDAAHYLREYGGKCENLHGHRFKVVAAVEVQNPDNTGLAYDFTELKRQLKAVLAQFDHVCLNDVAPFDSINPSSENIAATIFGRLKEMLPGHVRLGYVEVWESPQTWVRYVP
jgi:6-pyruvoyltetrahydropterin/6-carboxytetrahydropterin synthase